jgi:hypothetical protein
MLATLVKEATEMLSRKYGSSLRSRLLRSVLSARWLCAVSILCLVGAPQARAAGTKTGVAFSLYAVTGAQGATVALRSLVYSGGAPVSGLSVQFAVDGGAVGSAISDASEVSLPYTIPAGMPPGVHDVTVSFAGDASHYAARRTSPALTVRVVKANVGLSIYAASGAPGALVTLKSVVNSGGAPALGLTIQFAVDGGAVGSAISGASGAALGYTIPSAMTPGAHNVTVSFTGDATHNSATRTTVALTVTGGALQPLSAWPMFHQNALHTGAGIASGAAGNVKWSFPTGGVESSPAIAADGTVYVGTFDNYVYAINPSAGTQKWRFATGGWVHSSPAIGVDGTVYVGCDDGYVYAIKPGDGSQKWSFPTGGSVRSSPAIGSDGTVYVGSDDGASGTSAQAFLRGDTTRS